MPGTHGRENPFSRIPQCERRHSGHQGKGSPAQAPGSQKSLFPSVSFLFLSSSGFALGREGHQDSGALGTLLSLGGQGSSGTITDFAFDF